MSNDMLETMARAIWGDDYRPIGWEVGIRAAIAEMLKLLCNPSDQMLINGRAVLPEFNEPLQEDAGNCWKAMLEQFCIDNDLPPLKEAVGQ